MPAWGECTNLSSLRQFLHALPRQLESAVFARLPLASDTKHITLNLKTGTTGKMKICETSWWIASCERNDRPEEDQGRKRICRESSRLLMNGTPLWTFPTSSGISWPQWQPLALMTERRMVIAARLPWCRPWSTRRCQQNFSHLISRSVSAKISTICILVLVSGKGERRFLKIGMFFQQVADVVRIKAHGVTEASFKCEERVKTLAHAAEKIGSVRLYSWREYPPTDIFDDGTNEGA